jgi:hypothetical protein
LIAVGNGAKVSGSFRTKALPWRTEPYACVVTSRMRFR